MNPAAELRAGSARSVENVSLAARVLVSTNRPRSGSKIGVAPSSSCDPRPFQHRLPGGRNPQCRHQRPSLCNLSAPLLFASKPGCASDVWPDDLERETPTARRTSTASSRIESTEATGETTARLVDAVNRLPTRCATKFESNGSLNCWFATSWCA